MLMCHERRRRLRAVACAIALIATLLVLAPGRASAHAELAQSDPPAQAVLQRSPDQIQLSFTEPVDARSLEVTVVDASRKAVDRGDAALLAGTSDAVRVSLNPNVPPGTYTVQWKVTSTVDGHTTRGTVPFTVGDPGTLPPPVEIEAAASSGGVLGVVARWLTALAAVTLTGTFAFVPLMLSPALRLLNGMTVRLTGNRRMVPENAVQETTATEVAVAMTGRLLRVAAAALGLLLVGVMLLLFVEADVAGRSVGDWLTDSRRGTLWLVRAGLIVSIGAGLVVVTRDARARGAGAVSRTWTWALLTAFGAGALLTQSLGSHSAALRSQETLATMIDWLHLLAVAVWVGGLVQLGVSVLPSLSPLGGPPRTRLLAGLIPRFSLLAGASVVVIVASGIYQTIRLIGGWSAFTDETWGRALLVKLALFVLLLALAAFNLLVVRPRLAGLADRLDQSAREAAARLRSGFRRAVLAEAGVATVILIVVGVLISNSPSRATGLVPSGPFRPFVLDASADGLKGRLVLSPGRIGLNRFDLTVTTNSGEPVVSGTDVVLRITTLDQDTGISEAKTEALGGGRYTTTGTHLSTVGLWEIGALVRRPNADEVKLSFVLSLTSVTGQPEVRENRPAAPLERGRELFQQNCISCHGASARGDGPLAPALNPRPVDLTVHIPLHPDQAIYNFIANGIPRTAMQAWKEQFTDEEIQAIINYLRQVAEQANQSR